MCVGFSCTYTALLKFFCTGAYVFMIVLVACVCEERVFKLCMCLCVCVCVYMFVCVSECTTVNIRRSHAARYGRL